MEKFIHKETGEYPVLAFQIINRGDNPNNYASVQKTAAPEYDSLYELIIEDKPLEDRGLYFENWRVFKKSATQLKVELDNIKNQFLAKLDNNYIYNPVMLFDRQWDSSFYSINKLKTFVDYVEDTITLFDIHNKEIELNKEQLESLVKELAAAYQQQFAKKKRFAKMVSDCNDIKEALILIKQIEEKL